MMNNEIFEWRQNVSLELLRAGHSAEQVEDILRKLEPIVFSQESLK